AAAERRLEDEIAMVASKAKAADQKLYSGTVNVPRELTALQDAIDSLHRRQRQLEDQELELMEQAEPLEAALAELDAQRAALAAPVPGELLREYEGLRHALGGIGVARLAGNRCDGCHLTLSAVDVDRIRHEPPEAVVHCTECGRLLVRG